MSKGTAQMANVLSVGEQARCVASGSQAESVVLAIDVGGSFLKAALIDSDGSVLCDHIALLEIDAQGDRESVLDSLANALTDGLETCQVEQRRLAGIAVCIPGPFDYEQAHSLMKHKYQSIYGLDLRQAVRERIEGIEALPMLFESDAHAFLRGEAWLGCAKGHERIMAVTIGTGLGTGFMKESIVLHNGRGGPFRSIYGLPCQDGILEDYVSKRGIIRMFKSFSDEPVAEDIDVYEIARLALEDRNRSSLRAFRQVGQILGQSIKSLLREVEADCLVLGGQIAKAFVLFEETLRNELDSLGCLHTIAPGTHIDRAPLQGAAQAFWANIEKCKSAGS